MEDKVRVTVYLNNQIVHDYEQERDGGMYVMLQKAVHRAKSELRGGPKNDLEAWTSATIRVVVADDEGAVEEHLAARLAWVRVCGG